MTIKQLDPADVQELRRDTRSRPNPYVYGYGSKVPTEYWVKTFGRWRRVYVMIYGNSGSAYVLVKGEVHFLDSDTEHNLRALPQPCSSDISARHSLDLVKIWSGRGEPRVLCGYHAHREGLI